MMAMPQRESVIADYKRRPPAAASARLTYSRDAEVEVSALKPRRVDISRSGVVALTGDRWGDVFKIARGNLSGSSMAQASLDTSTSSLWTERWGNLSSNGYLLGALDYTKSLHAPEASDQFVLFTPSAHALFGPKVPSQKGTLEVLLDLITSALLGTADESEASAAVIHAIIFFTQLPEMLRTRLRPSIAISTEGELSMEFGKRDRRALILFDGEEAYGYAVLRDGKFVAGAESVKSPTALPADLLDYLAGIPA